MAANRTRHRINLYDIYLGVAQYINNCIKIVPKIVQDVYMAPEARICGFSGKKIKALVTL